MSASSFDSTHAVRFDLARGSVRARSSDERLLVIPAAVLNDLVRTAPSEAVDALARGLGAAIGRQAASRLDAVEEAPPDVFVTQLAGEAALAGIGLVSIERWGRALVVLIEESSLPGSMLPAFVEAALDAATGRKVRCALLMDEPKLARVLVTSERAVARVRDWIAAGASWGDALSRLHRGDA